MSDAEQTLRDDLAIAEALAENAERFRDIAWKAQERAEAEVAKLRKALLCFAREADTLWPDVWTELDWKYAGAHWLIAREALVTEDAEEPTASE